MKLPQLGKRLHTLMFVVAQSALGLGAYQTWRRAEPRHRGPHDEVLSALLARREAARAETRFSNADASPFVVAIAAALATGALRRKLGPRWRPVPIELDRTRR
jgi:hypothetical protein